MPLDPANDATPHSRGGAIRIYEAIKKANLHDRIFLVMITNRNSEAEFELSEIRADQKSFETPWAITHYPKPDTTPGPAPLERLLKPDDWKYAIGRAIGCCQDREWKRTFVRATLQEIVGVSTLLTQAKIEAERYAGKQVVVLTGETGTGKELIAAALHWHSTRCPNSSKGKKDPENYMVVNCQALNLETIESELFGNTKGAFTGADDAKNGYFGEFKNGTIFLDEFGTDAHCARKIDHLLRNVIANPYSFKQVGSTVDIHFQGSVIFGGSQLARYLGSDEAADDFSKSRLGAVPRINVPPLRDRPGDIIPLAKFFLKKACVESGIPEKQLSREAEEILFRHSWPGNVNELEKTMKDLAGRLVRVIGSEELPERIGSLSRSETTVGPQGISGDPTPEQVIDALKAENGNKSRAALLFYGISKYADEKKRERARYHFRCLLDRFSEADHKFASRISSFPEIVGRPSTRK